VDNVHIEDSEPLALARFEVLRAVTMKNAVFWDATSNLVTASFKPADSFYSDVPIIRDIVPDSP
jgi:hypothetical protein